MKYIITTLLLIGCAHKSHTRDFIERGHRAIAIEESRKVIAVIDTGINVKDKFFTPYLCQDWSYDLTGKGIADQVGHGTTVAKLILSGLSSKDYCLVVIKYYHKAGEVLLDVAKPFYIASTLHPVLVNYSSGGPDKSSSEMLQIKNLLEQGTHVVVSSGNNGLDLNRDCTYYPACSLYHYRFHVVGALAKEHIAKYSNKGDVVVHWENGEATMNSHYSEGTSFSAAEYSNRLLKLLREE